VALVLRAKNALSDVAAPARLGTRVTIAEALFGLQRYAEARPLLKREYRKPWKLEV